MVRSAKGKSQKLELISITTPENKKNIKITIPKKTTLKNFFLWTSPGIIISLVFLILGVYKYSRFYSMVPFGVLGSMICWFVKEIFNKIEDKFFLS